jgi:hypothetical protein
MNRLALHKLNLSATADRYLVNDSTVSWNQFKTTIDDVTTETNSFYTLMDSQWAARFFGGSALGPSYRAFMTGLADRKEGLLPRMKDAANRVDTLIREGASVQNSLTTGQGRSVQVAKTDVKREADALRAEATGLASAADTLGDVVNGITCRP